MRVICAWCRRERGPDGRYRPVVVEVSKAEVRSHGICAACSVALLERDERPRTRGPACQREI